MERGLEMEGHKQMKINSQSHPRSIPPSKKARPKIPISRPQAPKDKWEARRETDEKEALDGVRCRGINKLQR